MSQLPLDFPVNSSHDANDYKASPANIAAFKYIGNWPNWTMNALLLYGPAKSGKTHLSHIFQKKSAAQIITERDISKHDTHVLLAHHKSFVFENIESLRDEAALLHCFNRIMEAKGFLLLTSQINPVNLNIRLADLKSRVLSIPSFALTTPDAELLPILLLKAFSDRQLKISNEIVDYIIPRIERSFQEVQKVVSIIDRAALAEKKTITIPFIKRIMGW